jgi:hypothetical protein|tara:strand:- start:52 stop:552 length:501 start_codon:yes stop_codon:yes gene_type:complete
MTIKKLDILSVDFDWIRNARQQEELLNFLIPIVYSYKDITLSYSHDKIYPIFTHGYDEYNLVNIDHHHDFFYYGEEMKSLTEANWLFHLSNVFKKKINYTWISNPDSKYLHLREMKNLKSFIFDHSINYIKQKKFDKIFLCCSPDYATTLEVITSYKIIERLVNDK